MVRRDAEARGASPWRRSIARVAAAIAAIVAIAHRMQSETVAGIALFLGFHTGLLSEVTALSLITTTLLAAGAAFFLVANRWVIVPLSAVAAVYATHATLAFGDAAVGPALRIAFVAIDFALFATARLIAVDVRRFSPDQRILTFVLAGIALLGVSFVYARRDVRS